MVSSIVNELKYFAVQEAVKGLSCLVFTGISANIFRNIIYNNRCPDIVPKFYVNLGTRIGPFSIQLTPTQLINIAMKSLKFVAYTVVPSSNRFRYCINMFR